MLRKIAIVISLLPGFAFIHTAVAQTVDPCQYGCPKEGCGCPDEGGAPIEDKGTDESDDDASDDDDSDEESSEELPA